MEKATWSHQKFQFARCALGSDGRVWFIAQDGATYRMLQLKDGKWIQKSLGWDAVGICGRTDPSTELFVVGADGQVMRGTQTGFGEEWLDKVMRRPERIGIMRDARLVGGAACAVGMARQVYLRQDDGDWRMISDAIVRTGNPVVGFNSVDGSSPTNLVAVGLGGEIWKYDGQAWSQLDSPTNVSLNRVRIVSDGHAYACGQAGTLVEISGDEVRILSPGSTKQNLFGLGWFKGDLYVASQTAVFKLTDGGLATIDMRLGSSLTTGYLEANTEWLWSVGVHHLAVSADGHGWTAISCGL